MSSDKRHPDGRGVVNPDDLDEIDSLFFEPAGEDLVERVAPGISRVVALVSPKGGTGKTSIAVMLAGGLQSPRRRTGLMDLDPRGGVDRWSTVAGGLPFPTLRFNPSLGGSAFRRAVRDAMKEIDLLILDTPPAMQPAPRLALQEADLVLVPAGASTLDLEAAREAVDAVHEAQRRRGGGLPVVQIVPSRMDSRTRIARDFVRRFEELEVSVTPSIGQRVEVAAAANTGRLVRPGTVAGQEFRGLARHVWQVLRDLDE